MTSGCCLRVHNVEGLNGTHLMFSVLFLFHHWIQTFTIFDIGSDTSQPSGLKIHQLLESSMMFPTTFPFLIPHISPYSVLVLGLPPVSSSRLLSVYVEVKTHCSFIVPNSYGLFLTSPHIEQDPVRTTEPRFPSLT